MSKEFECNSLNEIYEWPQNKRCSVNKWQTQTILNNPCHPGFRIANRHLNTAVKSDDGGRDLPWLKHLTVKRPMDRIVSYIYILKI